MAKLATEYQGFLKFIARANKEIVSWFGPHCNHDPSKITFMAAREWDGMAEEEKKFFIKSQQIDAREGERRAPSGFSPFLCYLLHKRHTGFPSLHRMNRTSTISFFHPQQAKFHSEDWKALSKQERDRYSGIRLSELGIDHILEKRDELHRKYDPQELTILEFILKTQPKKPSNSRTWFLKMEGLAIKSEIAKERWKSMTEEEKRFYEECAKLDRKRFNFERNAWITKLISIDLNGDTFTIDDFVSQRAKSDIETLSSMIELNKDLMPKSQLKKPLSAFSLFIRDYRYRIRDEQPIFRFGQHLRESSIAWSKLSEEERQEYKDRSRQLRELYNQEKQLVNSSGLSKDLKPYELSAALFRHIKSINGPSRPSHLLVRVPNVKDIFGKATDTRKSDREKAWNLLSEAEREPYYQDHERLRNQIDVERNKIKMKMSYVRELMERAKELERVKTELHLLRTRRTSTKKLVE